MGTLQIRLLVLGALLLLTGGVTGTVVHRYEQGRFAVERERWQRDADTALQARLKDAATRAAAAEQAARDAAQRQAAAQNQVAGLLRKIRNAPLPTGCVTPDLRLRVNETVSAINSYGHPQADTGPVPAGVPESAASGRKPQ